MDEPAPEPITVLDTLKLFDPTDGKVVLLEFPPDCPYLKKIDGVVHFICGTPMHGNEPCQYTEWHFGFEYDRLPLMAAAIAEWWDECAQYRFEIDSGSYAKGSPEQLEILRCYECTKKARAWRRFTLKPKKG